MSQGSVVEFGDFLVRVVVTDPPWYENCYIVQHIPSGEQIVVDPGSNAERIVAAVEENGGKVSAIMLTHGHPDHLGAVNVLQSLWNVPCRLHQDEAPLVRDIAAYAKRRLGIEVQAPSSFETFDEETPLSLGGVAFRAFPTPGHTPGGVCFVFDAGFVLTGDTIFNRGIGRTDLPGGDGPLLVRSITRLLQSLPGPLMLYPGHGPGWTVAEAQPWWAAMVG